MIYNIYLTTLDIEPIDIANKTYKKLRRRPTYETHQLRLTHYDKTCEIMIGCEELLPPDAMLMIISNAIQSFMDSIR